MGIGADSQPAATTLPPTADEEEVASRDWRQTGWARFAAVVLVLGLGLGLARVAALRWRMPDYQTRFAIVLLTFFAGWAIMIMGWPPRRGIDLRGGVILVYEIAEPTAQSISPVPAAELDVMAEGPRVVEIDKLIQAVSRRVNPGGVKEVTIRPLGDSQIEVIIPEADREEVERIKRKISAAGTLEFRILANNRDHATLIEQAMQRPDRELRDPEGRLLAWWVPITRGRENDVAVYPEIATRKRTDPKFGYEFTEVLVVKDPFDVTGAFLVHSAPGFDRTGAPCVYFTFNQEGGARFGGLTGNNLPEEGQEAFQRKLGIILDGYLYSAPAIRDTIFTHGEITGRFTREEVQDLVDVLNAGSLPATLSEQPVSELVIGPTLGRDTVRRGTQAMIISAVLVCIFMIVYYRFAGVIACLGLLQTVLLILAVMISIRAAFTLPGLAGLVLTLGMAVDANVIIYERIREELDRGAALRMAIRNGFGRAMSAIVDANLTTLITATVLYVIGRDQIKGFAVTLWLGVVMSMFAMIYCCRVLFDVAERQRWISRLKMMRLFATPSIRFMEKAPIAVAGSVVLIVIGILAVFARGKGLLDIDFTGGVSIEVEFTEPQDIGLVRAKLGDQGVGLQDLAISDVRRLDDPTPGRHFIVNTSGVRGMDPNADPSEMFAEVQRRIKEVFGKQLAHYSMRYELVSSPQQVGSLRRGTGSNARINSAARPEESAWTQRPRQPGALVMGGTSAGLVGLQIIQSAVGFQGANQTAASAENPTAETLAAEPALGDVSAFGGVTTEAKSPAPGAAPASEAAAAQPTAPPARESPEGAQASSTVARLIFEQAVVYETVDQLLAAAIEQEQKAGQITGNVAYKIRTVSDGNETELAAHEWEVEVFLAPAVAEEILRLVQARVNDTPYFPSINTVGGAVAVGTRVVAIAAVLSSLVFIVAYIWLRFQRVIYGLAAVVALIHDVLITLGAIALSAYLANFLGFLLIDEFKISLSVLAAFLTIIGYSLNDTIIVFDRIREVKGRAPRLTVEMIDKSINQTLSRTILTAVTTLIVMIVLYVGGGQAIHAFTFSLLVGITVGTYSSIFIASPLLIWLTK